MVKVTEQNSKLMKMILFFALPIVALSAVLGLIASPALFVHPMHNFVYAVCQEYSCGNSFSLNSSGTIIEESTWGAFNYETTAQLYIYNVTTDTYSAISLEQANSLKLSHLTTSADGYTVAMQPDEQFLFFDDNQNSTPWAIKKGLFAKPITLADESNYSTHITFLGWEQ